jgi:outer membrane protein OmpA-like peptidoglycan-associated protein
MKNILIVLILFCFANTQAQQKPNNIYNKIGLHFLLNDFNTNLFNPAYTMHSGFGIDYYKAIKNKIDVVGTLNLSSVNYIVPPLNLPFGSNNLLLDVNMGAHIKTFDDSKTINPFIIAKVGYSKYVSLNGFSVQPGVGLQFNVYNDVFIISTIEYRKALNNKINNLIYYSIGLSTNIGKPIAKQPKVVRPKTVKVKKASTKEIAIKVTDEATRLPLQYVEVNIIAPDGTKQNVITNDKGIAIFNAITAANYTVAATLNGIEASGTSIYEKDFNVKNNQLQYSITHNDPRFTLVGIAIDKTANMPIEGTVVTIKNITKGSTSYATSTLPKGEFRTQLESNCEYEIVGKKESYISNIEKISTQGLKRSAILYVELELGIEEAKAGKTIVLNKIYFATGSASVDVNASSDLNKLIQFLKDNPNAKLEIQGHTDNVGSKDLNLKLSQQRASSIVSYLTQNGITTVQLIAIGYGDTKPVATNATTEGRSQNRRVEMKVIE